MGEFDFDSATVKHSRQSTIKYKLQQLIMSDFEEEFEIPATSEVDPAAEFLAKEQAELGDIGEDLGIAPAASQPAADNDNFLTEGENDLFSPAPPVSVSLSGGDDNPFLVADTDSQASELSTGMSKLYVAKEEPEFMRKWKEEQKARLEKKDQEETAAMEELKVKAKQELEDWYKRYETQIEKTRNCNREEETKYEGNEMNHIEPGSEWERVAKHCDFSAKAPGHSKDVSRLRSIMLQLKQNQTVPA